ncbi:LysM peptidoglycan-binding domain-containing protein (plasmid) [Kitasatospora sp. NBC_00070]|uniref:LysM peptidoglycan-binding domain-containing protein n=1 Tax=Kitasatospora sp. NBC_00070 TaxID=2975962 RepID=UPI002F90EED1
MGVPTQYSNWSAGHDRAKIACLTPPLIGAVVFNYNPSKISFKRTSKTRTRGTLTGFTGSQLERSQLASISVADITLEGPDTKARCDLLMGWSAPPEGIAGALMSMTGFFSIDLPKLTFQWGPPVVGFFYIVVLTNVDISYVRFDKLGQPTRATVSLMFEEQPSLGGTIPTNPTSGGLAGRSSHQVSEGEGLVQITTQHLGHPRHWRAIARANGIDDPLRLRPGQTVYLPTPEELEEES